MTFSKNSIRVSNGFNQDQDGDSAGSDLGSKMFTKVISRR